MNDPAHASVRGLIRRNGRMLLLKHLTSYGAEVWSIPGGRAQIGEDPRDALVREVKEETTLNVVVNETVGVYGLTWDDDAKGAVAIVFHCNLIGGTVDITNNPNEEEPVIDFDWINPSQIDGLPMHPDLKEIVTGNAL